MSAGPFKRIYIGLIALVVVLAHPLSVAFAESNPDQANSTITTSTTPQTTPAPDGPDADAYIYNETTKQWENDYYIWDPATRTARPKRPLTYSYNPKTSKWDTTEWRYNTSSKKYEPNNVSVEQPPEGSVTTSGPEPTATTDPPLPVSDPPTLQTPPNGSVFDGFYNANISNTFTSGTQSGDATVTGNTAAGDATTGDATATTTILNLLQSSAPLGNGSPYTTFVSNIDGNVVGDLFIDPAMLNSLQAATTNASHTPAIQVTNSTDNTITNHLTLDAQTGNATVSNNTVGGNATSGDANGVANLINLLNSSIVAGQSFIGFLNINGNLNGDVLLPPNTLNTLLAAGGGTPPPSATPLRVESSNSGSINNLVTTHATSGNAAVTGNTAAGDAKSGNGQTNITLLDLTRHEIVGGNSLLVFVNVLGKWIGAIVDAPTGSTTAALGGSISKNNVTLDDTSVTSTTNNNITNTVDIKSASGDATINSNTLAGNARSGNATASANIANIIGSNLSLSDWFGVLFINVFGTWNGSFGIDTAAGSILTQPPTTIADAKPVTAPVFQFRQKRIEKRNALPLPTSQDIVATATTHDDKQTAILGATSDNNDTIDPVAGEHYNLSFAIWAVVLGATLVCAERLLATRDNRRVRQM
jgi:hypothetical protein